MAENIDLQVLGSSGLKQFNGVIDEEFHPKLRGENGIKTYREMSDNSSVIGIIQWLIEILARQVEWRIEPANTKDNQALDWAMFLEQCKDDMETDFESFISEVLSFTIYGWAYFEILYKMRRGYNDDIFLSSEYDDGKIGWADFGLRSQDTLDRWQFNEENNRLEGMYQSDYYANKEAFIPIEKAIHFVTKKYKNNPEGRSIYRNSVVDYWFLKKISILEGIGVERDLTGVPVMQVPPDLLKTKATAEEKALMQELDKMMSQLKNDERAHLIIPSEMSPGGDGNQTTGFKFGLLSSPGSKQINTIELKKQYKTNILQTALAQFVELGTQGVGSFALASSQTNLFAMSLGTILDIIANTLNKQAVRPLMRINNCPYEFMPYFVHGDVESPPLDEIGTYIQSLANSGQLPEDDKIKRKLLEFANLPIPDLDEDENAVKEPKPPLKGVAVPRKVIASE